MKSVHIEISGKVQGVFFRATAQKVARFHNITGWIKNTYNNKVETLITGEDEDVEKFISWCKRGPEKSKVENVIIANVELQSFNGFEIRR